MVKTLRFLAPVLLVAAAGAPAEAQTCTVTREQVLADLAEGATTDDLARKYANCTAGDNQSSTAATAGDLFAAATGAENAFSEGVKDTGSTFWEAIRSCGYHPQREEANCSVEIRQRFGFGGPICRSRGSHEYLLFCADLGGGLVPIHTNGFHIHDESQGAAPNWNFSATIQSNPRLLSLPNDGRTLRGRVILSWAIPPAGCNFQPIWGNQSDFRFRLDP